MNMTHCNHNLNKKTYNCNDFRNNFFPIILILILHFLVYFKHNIINKSIRYTNINDISIIYTVTFIYFKNRFLGTLLGVLYDAEDNQTKFLQ